MDGGKLCMWNFWLARFGRKGCPRQQPPTWSTTKSAVQHPLHIPGYRPSPPCIALCQHNTPHGLAAIIAPAAMATSYSAISQQAPDDDGMSPSNGSGPG